MLFYILMTRFLFLVVACLREVPAENITRSGFIISSLGQAQLPNFIPRIDEEFVTQRPEDSWYEGQLVIGRIFENIVIVYLRDKTF